MMVHNFDPVLFDFGIIEIRWYSLAYIFGILAGWFYGKKVIKKLVTNTNQNNYTASFDDLIGYIIIGVIIGGRLGYVFFYNPFFYFENFLEIFKLWKGGMSFHGGLVGVILSTYIFSISKGLNYKIYFDTISCVAPIGIFLGRIANFITSELYGIPTEKPWGVIFPKIDNLPRHPSQIYEALFEGLILFIILNYLIYKKKLLKVHGVISAIFLILYSSSRFFIEFFREPDLQIGYLLFNLTLGQILCLIFFSIGFFLLKKNERL